MAGVGVAAAAPICVFHVCQHRHRYRLSRRRLLPVRYGRSAGSGGAGARCNARGLSPLLAMRIAHGASGGNRPGSLVHRTAAPHAGIKYVCALLRYHVGCCAQARL